MAQEKRDVLITVDKEDYVRMRKYDIDISKVMTFLFKSFANRIEGDIGLILETQYIRELLKIEKMNGSNEPYIEELEVTLRLKEKEVKQHLELMKTLDELRELDTSIAKHGYDIKSIQTECDHIIKKNRINLEHYIENRVAEDTMEDNPLIDYAIRQRYCKGKLSTSEVMKHYI